MGAGEPGVPGSPRPSVSQSIVNGNEESKPNEWSLILLALTSSFCCAVTIQGLQRYEVLQSTYSLCVAACSNHFCRIGLSQKEFLGGML